MTNPNAILERVKAMGAKSAGLRRDMAAAWVKVHTAVASHARDARLSDQELMARYNTARLAMLTAIVEGRREAAAKEALAAVGLE